MCTVLCLSFWGLGCNPEDTGDGGSTARPKSNQLPELELRDETDGLLVTWLDEKGEFHVVQKLSEVPEGHRERVRVVKTDVSDGHGDLLYVADLTKKGADGRYHVETMSRSEWDELGASRRRKRMEALAPSAVASAPAPSPSAEVQGQLKAIVYGADWCKPCHDAEAHLKRRGVAVVHKDIERDPSAAREMQQKLDRAGMGQGSIPVIDLSGRMFKGFSPGALDSAIAKLKTTATL